ncbi:A24 family peptidase [Roseovarius tibetensis]|uniref:A24 family peptidase n=1 Tax=Roseovarius tibetensis TaxID=2685897 RepID=UPI003D7FE628
MQDGLLILASAWFIAGQGVAAASDAVWMRIPNALTLYLLAGAALCAVQAGPVWLDLAARMAVGLSVLAGGFVLFAKGWMGGGDVKLLAVTALWLGPAATPGLLILTALGGGILTLALIAARALGAGHLAGHRIAALREPMDRVPYGIAIAAAAIATVILRPDALLIG